jgi:hypothetical protein
MNKIFRALMVFAMLCILALVLLSGCGNPSSQVISSSSNTPDTPPVIVPPTDKPSAPPPITSPIQNPTSAMDRVDAIYFHMNQRCVTCLCFEQRITDIINKYFSDDIKSGKLTYKVLNAQEPQNTAIAEKYGVIGSSFFINTVINGVDHIKDIQDIWNWKCGTTNSDQKVKSIIEQSLKNQA